MAHNWVYGGSVLVPVKRTKSHAMGGCRCAKNTPPSSSSIPLPTFSSAAKEIGAWQNKKAEMGWACYCKSCNCKPLCLSVYTHTHTQADWRMLQTCCVPLSCGTDYYLQPLSYRSPHLNNGQLGMLYRFTGSEIKSSRESCVSPSQMQHSNLTSP